MDIWLRFENENSNETLASSHYSNEKISATNISHCQHPVPTEEDFSESPVRSSVHGPSNPFKSKIISNTVDTERDQSSKTFVPRATLNPVATNGAASRVERWKDPRPVNAQQGCSLGHRLILNSSSFAESPVSVANVQQKSWQKNKEIRREREDSRSFKRE